MIALSRRQFASLGSAVVLAGCAGGRTVDELRDPVPENFVSDARVPGYGGVRFWGDDASSIAPDKLAKRRAQMIAAVAEDPSLARQPTNILTVSGGGSNGAFGAGVLVGWDSAGHRPNFDLVTGISTGSLTAPFAFLGKPYDDELKAAYTQISTKDILVRRSFFAILGGASIASNDPLRQLVRAYVTEKMLVDITHAHSKGRRLLIGTTNIDAERPVVWDIGEIASSSQPGRRELIEDILVASSSIPGVFPPVRIKVTADGKSYDELHVDGGTSNQVFLLPADFSIKGGDPRLGAKRKKYLYIIRNGKTTPEYSQVKPALASVAGKALSSLTKTQGIGDLYRLYAQATRDGVDYNYIAMPETFTMKEQRPFDPAYMKALYDVGFAMGSSRIPWHKLPPGYG